SAFIAARYVETATAIRRRDEQRVQSARFREHVEIVKAGMLQKQTVGIEQTVETIDQNADRDAIEHRAFDRSMTEWRAIVMRIVRFRLGRAGDRDDVVVARRDGWRFLRGVRVGMDCHGVRLRSSLYEVRFVRRGSRRLG